MGLPFLPFWGALADRYARKPIIIRSFLVHLVASVASALAGNVWVFLVGRSIMSFSLGNNGFLMATLAERIPLKRQGLAFAIMNSAAPVGIFVGPLMGGPTVDRRGVRTLLGIDAILMLSVVLALFGLPRSVLLSGTCPDIENGIQYNKRDVEKLAFTGHFPGAVLALCRLDNDDDIYPGYRRLPIPWREVGYHRGSYHGGWWIPGAVAWPGSG